MVSFFAETTVLLFQMLRMNRLQEVARAAEKKMLRSSMQRRLLWLHTDAAYNVEVWFHQPQISRLAPITSVFESRRFQSNNAQSSPFDPKAAATSSSETITSKPPRRRPRKTFIPRKAAVQLTDRARTFFKMLLEASKPEIAGVMLKYHQSSSGEPRMVFSFDFVRKEDLSADDEGVSLEVKEDGTPKPPVESMNDGLRKLYVHHGGFLKVLGATVDVDPKMMVPILYDREGNKMDPNA